MYNYRYMDMIEYLILRAVKIDIYLFIYLFIIRALYKYS